jgi:hypothetical protein
VFSTGGRWCWVSLAFCCCCGRDVKHVHASSSRPVWQAGCATMRARHPQTRSGILQQQQQQWRQKQQQEQQQAPGRCVSACHDLLQSVACPHAAQQLLLRPVCRHAQHMHSALMVTCVPNELCFVVQPCLTFAACPAPCALSCALRGPVPGRLPSINRSSR